MNNMTALVSFFARAYHRWANVVPVFDDTAAEALLGEDFRQIAQNMQQGAAFFLPGFTGTPEEALRRIVDGQLAPSVLARSAFCERALARETAQDCRQYVILAAGYDTFAMRNKEDRLAVFELDLPEVLEDKRIRIERAALSSGAKPIPCDLSESAWVKKLVSSGFHPAESAFFSLLGISYYLSEPDFRSLLRSVGHIAAVGSALCLDYPTDEESRIASVNRALAQGAGEAMNARYSPCGMEELLCGTGFRVREHLSAEEMTQRYFSAHNAAVPECTMAAPDGVRYILAERTE